MKVLLNEQGYVESYALEGELVDALETAEPNDLSHFEKHFTSYRMRDGTLVFDEGKDAQAQSEAAKAEYRRRRELECFPIINRGQLWYATLSVKQLAELTAWYTAWLKVTETKTIPERPAWLE